MNTLDAEPMAGLLKRLFADSDVTMENLKRQADANSAAGGGGWNMPDASNYLEFYSKLKDVHIPVSAATGKLLYMLVRATRAQSVVEFGTSFGISTLHLAAAMRDNGGGRIISTEFEPSKIVKAQANLQAGRVADLVEIRAGDALDTLARDLPERIDIVLLDGAKPLYLKVLELLEPRLHSGALVLADNADLCPEYLEHIRAPTSRYTSLPFGGDVELSLRD